tara:strand:+ start:60 stop:503 length:444 start_codon:yes stop_codon:yes gene_type:complete
MLKKLIIFIFFFYFNNLFASDEYFLTLRNNEVNLRQGPSLDYPIKMLYKKKFLPVIVQDSFDNFKKIRDHENNTGWIHISQLSKKKAAISVDDNVLIFKKPTIYSKPQVVLEKGKLCIVIKCKNDWCKVKADNYVGWAKKESFWGRL